MTPNRRTLLVLLAVAAALFTASMGALALPALDDCHYARKGLEMAQRGAFFSVTWNGTPTTQHPPLQFWLIGRSLALFGESDFAARLPVVLMALGILLGTYRIGTKLLGESTAVTAVALLLACPFFVNNARRCMLDVPLTFWFVACLVVLVEGWERPRLHLLLAIPLAGAILTKSVLGLGPLVVALPACLLTPSGRRVLMRPWLWFGAAAGVALGASWIVQQYQVLGPEAMETHFAREVVGRSLAGLGFWKRFDYLKVLVESYEPVAPLAVPGAWMLFRAWRADPEQPSVLAALWAFLPVAAYSVSSAHSPRYLVPLFPGLALCAAVFVDRAWPRAADVFRRFVVPGLAGIVALLLWIAPHHLVGQGTAVFRDEGRTLLGARVKAGQDVPYFGTNYWGIANPMLWYTHAHLALPPDTLSAETLAAVVAVAKAGPGVMVLQRDVWEHLPPAERPGATLMEGGDWLLLDVRRPPL